MNSNDIERYNYLAVNIKINRVITTDTDTKLNTPKAIVRILRI